MSIGDFGDDRLCYSRTTVATCNPQSNNVAVGRQAYYRKLYDNAPEACEIDGLQEMRDSFCERLQSDLERLMEPCRKSIEPGVVTARACLVKSVRGCAAAPIESWWLCVIRVLVASLRAYDVCLGPRFRPQCRRRSETTKELSINRALDLKSGDAGGGDSDIRAARVVL